MKKKYIQALDKITSKLLNMDDSSFNELIQKHIDGEYANILLSANICVDNDCYHSDSLYSFYSYQDMLFENLSYQTIHQNIKIIKDNIDYNDISNAKSYNTKPEDNLLWQNQALAA
jgi:hypothetical protein